MLNKKCLKCWLSPPYKYKDWLDSIDRFRRQSWKDRLVLDGWHSLRRTYYDSILLYIKHVLTITSHTINRSILKYYVMLTIILQSVHDIFRGPTKLLYPILFYSILFYSILFYSILFYYWFTVSSIEGLQQSLTLSLPLWVAGLFTISPAVVSCWTVLLGLAVAGTVGVGTSNGISLTIGRLVLPCAVLIFVARTSPFLPVINSSTIANFHVFLRLSSCTRMMSLGFTSWLLFPVVLWYSLRKVRYSYLQHALNWLSRKACSWALWDASVTQFLQVLFIHYCVGQCIFYVWGDVC